MFPSNKLFLGAFILLVLFICFNLLHFKYAHLVTTTYYSLGINEKLNHHFKQTFGKYFKSDLQNDSEIINLTENIFREKDDNTVAEKLNQQVRVFIWVMTAPQYHDTRAKAVRDTWGKHCDHLVFFSTKDDPELPAIALNVSEGYLNITPKTRKAFRYLYENHFNDADWFMKADDDTYIIVENLKYFLSEKDPNEPLYFGQHFTVDGIKQGYQSGGAGYVISKEALRRFGNSSNMCETDGWAEDMEFGRCMERLGVRIEDSKDALGRSRFHCMSLRIHLLRQYPDWYKIRDPQGGTRNVSDYAISFHYIKPEDMYIIEFFIYHMRPYGILPGLQNLNRH